MTAEEFLKENYPATYMSLEHGEYFGVNDLCFLMEKYVQELKNNNICNHFYQLDINNNPRCIFCGKHLIQ